MQAFFNFIISMVSDLVSLYFSLPFLDNISLGDITVGIFIFSLLIGALVSQLRSFSLSTEAGQANYEDARAERIAYWKSRKGGD